MLYEVITGLIQGMEFAVDPNGDGDPSDHVDIIIDGGNCHYKDTLRRATMLQEKGIHLVDVGTSGGVWGLAEGYSMMVSYNFV